MTAAKNNMMKCSIKSHNKDGSTGFLVRRKFVPIQFKLIRENQFVNAGAKLPFTTNKVIGILVTNKVDSCSEAPFPTTHYFGVSDVKTTNTHFLNTNEGNQYDSPYPPDVLIEGEPGKWWYYMHPVVDRDPYFLTASVGFQQLENPIQAGVLHKGQCLKDQYHLWSGQISERGNTILAFFPIS